MKKSQGMIRIGVLLILIYLLWNTIFIKPIKVFTVFLHELGHFLCATLVGYDVVSFQVKLNESGFVSFVPVNPNVFKEILVASAGYLGSLIFAVLILKMSGSKYRRTTFLILSILTIGIAIFYSGISFTLLFSVILGILCYIVVKLRNETLERTILEVVGFTSIFYAIGDTFVDTVVYYFTYGKTLPTDSVALSNATHIPAVLWGLLWTALAVFIAYRAIRKQITV